jgi:hypothetical protein
MKIPSLIFAQVGNLHGVAHGGAIYRIPDYSHANDAPSIFGTEVMTERIR